MTTARVAAAILAAVTSFLALAAPSHAQIAAYYADGTSKMVFVNSDSRSGRAGSTISDPASSQETVDVPRPARRWPALPPPSAPQAITPVEMPATVMTTAAATRASTQAEDRLDRIVREAAERNKVDPALVKAVISTESGWNPRAISRKGAVGLMQLEPSTAQRYGVNNSFDPAQNVEGGTKYLRSLLDRYNGDLTKSLAAYNAGERTVDVNGGVPAIPETQRYVRKVTDTYFQPGSGRNPELWSPPKSPVRREVDSNGRVVFTNE